MRSPHRYALAGLAALGAAGGRVLVEFFVRLQRRDQLGHGHLGLGRRRNEQAHRRGQEGGHAERDRPAADLGELRQRSSRHFTKKYGIKVNSANPDGSSQDEVNAVKQENGTAAAPDVMDVGMAVALANTSLFAPYKVSTWSAIPAAQKDADGLWYQDYGGYMSIGYSSKFGTITSLSQLLEPKFKGAVALNGEPDRGQRRAERRDAGQPGQGGIASNIAKGVTFFHKLKQAATSTRCQATGATIKAGTTPVVFNWDYLNLPSYVGVSNWKVFIPSGAVAGRLLRAGHQQERAAPGRRPAVGGVPVLAGRRRRAEPVAAGRRAAGGAAGHDLQRHDRQSAARRSCPPVSGTPVFLSQTQATDAANYLAANWAKAVS